MREYIALGCEIERPPGGFVELVQLGTDNMPLCELRIAFLKLPGPMRLELVESRVSDVPIVQAGININGPHLAYEVDEDISIVRSRVAAVHGLRVTDLLGARVNNELSGLRLFFALTADDALIEFIQVAAN